ncbi:hypothetical protein J2Z21_007374 [Streptomyces griseochromogenes]|uniref:Uncharacterized protein n=1 Tax=Streptomyces griseochromogenes TaxID=68214 RepID=A0A1B1B987_9ACTN|nr:hypothetical protein [Streptomyces griseochromogenes]ANP55396.1 hypothetical protein AVL59_42545 [Streptomyces griseochromogenes]MBP2054369.1 hypothetical protein [Streptomyces griseochromogenes]
MGTDIHGWIECRTWQEGLAPGETAWCPAVDLAMIAPARDYDAFACLFGVRDLASHWRPVAAGRDLPPGTSAPVRAERDSWGGAAFGTTWLSWAEARAIDWDEPALPRSTHIAQYHRAPDGTLGLRRPWVWSRAFARAAGINTLTTDPSCVPGRWPEGTQWESGASVFRVERSRRRDAVPPDGTWGPVWAIMGALACVHGDDGVRLVVWFDE